MLCADAALRDAETNSISIFSIFEEITVQTLPILIPRFVIVNLLEREETDPATPECQLKIKLGEDILLEQQLRLNFQEKKRTRSIVTIGGLPLTHSGLLSVAISYDNEPVADYTIEVAAPVQLNVQALQG